MYSSFSFQTALLVSFEEFINILIVWSYFGDSYVSAYTHLCYSNQILWEEAAFKIICMCFLISGNFYRQSKAWTVKGWGFLFV